MASGTGSDDDLGNVRRDDGPTMGVRTTFECSFLLFSPFGVGKSAVFSFSVSISFSRLNPLPNSLLPESLAGLLRFFDALP